MGKFQKATKLTEVAAAVDLKPLESGDPRYVDISAGRGGSDELVLLGLCLMDHDAEANRFAKIAFTGHRGGGKSTELLKLEHEVSDRFTVLHLYADDALISDYEYSDLFLWLVDELVRKFEERGTPLDHRLVEDVATWFVEVTLKQIDQVKSEITLETEARAKAKVGLFTFSLELLAKLKSMMVGSTERRKEIRRELQNYSSDLIRRVNLLLDNAHTVLKKHGKPANLLVVVDNLDRLPPEVSGPLFFKNGEFLKQPRAHFIYTVPIAIVLAPNNIGMVFESRFTLSMVKVRDRKGKAFTKGLDSLVDIIGERVDLDAIFTSRKVARDLAAKSGGSVRDLMRLVGYAQLSARVDDKDRIDSASVKRAVRKMRLEFEQLLVPGRTYFPLLVQIHQSKGDGSVGLDSDPEKVQKYRDFFSHFLFNGSVLEYNGDRMWYDVHPVIEDIESFQKALDDAQGPAKLKTAE